MKHSIAFLLFIASLSFNLTLVSCKKKCKVDELAKDTGVIIENVTIIPSSGSLTGNMGTDFLIDATHQHANAFQIRFGDSARVNVDYSKYCILANPMRVKCNVALDREVLIDDVNQKVTYSVKATQCSDCTSESYIENYVLVPAFPSNYTLELDTLIINKN
jgi:hypothetical protein